MKKLGVLFIVLLLVAVSACSKSKVKDNDYKVRYTTDPDTFNYIYSGSATNSDHLANFVDGLLDYNSLGELVGTLATDWSISDDGLTYTLTIRDDAKWYTADGEEYATVVAQDFVTGLQVAADGGAASKALYVAESSIAGLKDYIGDRSIGFDGVGVKAIDETTVQYTLTRPEPYFLSKLTYGVFYPVNAEFYASKGGVLGQAYNADTNKFGSLDRTSILYNGAFLLSEFTPESSIVYTRNENYFNVDNVHIPTVTYTFFDGQNTRALYDDYKNGNLTAVAISASWADFSDIISAEGDNVTVSQTTQGSYPIIFNFSRQAYNYAGDKTDTQKSDTHTAIMNKNFRLAIISAINRESMNAQSAGEAYAKLSLRNVLTPPEFVKVGTDFYGDVVAKEVVAMTNVFGSDLDLSDGQDAFYNADRAKELFATAKEELTAAGVSFPIVLDLPYYETSSYGAAKTSSIANSIMETLGEDNVVVKTQPMPLQDYYYANYIPQVGSDADYDISVTTGWLPDYQDPSTYLEIYAAGGAFINNLGFIDEDHATDLPEEYAASQVAYKALGYDEFEGYLAEAAAITDESKLSERYAAYAKADAWLIANGIISTLTTEGGAPRLTRAVPFTANYGYAGLSDSKLIGIQIQDDTVTKTQYDKAKSEWDSARAKLSD